MDRWQKLRQTFRARIQTLSRLTPYQRDPKFVPPVVVSPPILMEFQYDSVYLINFDMDAEEYIVPVVLYRHEQWILCNRIWVQKWEVSGF